jgi:ATP-dependent DNA helicase RecG
LASLVGPLRYACARNFENLKSVKGLKAPIEAALAKGQGALAPHVAQAVRAELLTVDAADAAVRKASLSRLAAVLGHEGLDVGIAAVPKAPTAAVAPVALSPSKPSTGPDGALRRAQGERPMERTSAEPQRAPPAAPPKPKKPRAPKKPATPAPDSEEAPARMLSISPAEGPLSRPLRNAGWRMNPQLLKHLEKKGVRRVGDALFLVPRAYEDRRVLKHIAQLRAGEKSTFVAEVRAVDEARGRGRRIFKAVLADASGSIAATHYQGGSWLKGRYPIGKKLVVSGEVRQSTWGWEIPHPEIEPADDLETSAVHFKRVVPIYPGFERHEQRQLRELTHRVAKELARGIEDPLPEALKARVGLMGLGEALEALHFPAGDADLAALEAHRSPAHQRLAFDELFFLQLGMALKRQGLKRESGIAFDVSADRVARAKRLLPFKPTGAQDRVLAQILKDMGRPEPMNRLLQGDVGSGKTAVALVAAAVAVQSGLQVAVMAPTEILAEQHARTFTTGLAALGVEVVLVTGSGSAKEREKAREAVATGKARVAIGTHALIQDPIAFQKLGLVVIDEQHRFGVIQRHALMAKGTTPDVLVMTATPIPRTLAMTLYGDLDVSILDELPPGRTPIETRVYSPKSRAHALALVEGELQKGHQAFVVYPLVEESEKLDLADATQGAAQLSSELEGRRVGLLHGRMKADEKDAVMQAFREKALDVLVSTTVIEVGVDVPNASVMVVEHAERFGLSQLHQLRGRVGRGAARSYCLLFAGGRSEDAQSRLEVMAQTTDGFVIAEKDLELRGPGELLGTRQSGLPEMVVANLARDQALLALAQEEARAIVERDPTLAEHRPLAKALAERWEGRLKLAGVG